MKNEFMMRRDSKNQENAWGNLIQRKEKRGRDQIDGNTCEGWRCREVNVRSASRWGGSGSSRWSSDATERGTEHGAVAYWQGRK